MRLAVAAAPQLHHGPHPRASSSVDRACQPQVQQHRLHVLQRRRRKAQLQPAARAVAPLLPLGKLRRRLRGQTRGEVACCASGVASLLSSAVSSCGCSTVWEWLATVLGSAMGAGSLLLYSPIVLRLVRTWDAQGMAASTWALQLFGFTAACIYNYAKGHSLSAYGETLVFAVQSGAILLLVCHLQQRLRTRAFACGAAAFCALLCWAAAGLPPVALALLQLLSSVVVTSALLPQLLLNARRRSSGGWSPLTAGLSACGNALRVFTTLQLTHDALLLAGYMAGFAVNAALLAQIVVFGEGAQSSPS